MQKVQKLSHPSFLEGRAFSINVNKKKIGMFGEVHPQVILNFKLKQPIIALELQIVQQFPEIEFFI